MEIKYFNREKNTLEAEKVYGEGAVKWLYESSLGKGLSQIVIQSWISKLYGEVQSLGITRDKVDPFIKKFSIDMDSFLPEEGRTEVDPYSCFNQFFIRRFKKGKRTFVAEKNRMPAPCEARYFGFNQIDEETKFPVKGEYLDIKGLIGDAKKAEPFIGGPLYIARLCPVDYHRFHFPDNGKLTDQFRVGGVLHSVNPLALKYKPDIFLINEREVNILETENFGKLAYIEVGAVCVGRIVQSFKGRDFKRGDEKGYFLFGGSTVVVIGEPGKWKMSDDIAENTKKGIETYLKIGDEVGRII